MAEEEQIVNEGQVAGVTTYDFLKGLQERVSRDSASLLLDSALLGTGIGGESPLDKEQAKTLCLALIKKGGPAFQVGQALYRRI